MKERLIHLLNSLTAKYVAVFTLLVAVPAIGISWYLLDSSYNDNKQALIRLHQQKAQALATAIGRGLQEHAHRLASLHAEGVPFDVLERDVMLPFRIDDPTIVSISYIDANGRLRAQTVGDSAARRLNQSTGLNKERFFKKANQNGVYFGPLKLGPLQSGLGGPFQDCDCRILIAARDGYGGGGVFREIYGIGDAFPDFVASELGTSGYAYAVTADATPISYPNRDVFAALQGTSQAVQDAAAGREGPVLELGSGLGHRAKLRWREGPFSMGDRRPRGLESLRRATRVGGLRSPAREDLEDGTSDRRLRLWLRSRSPSCSPGGWCARSSACRSRRRRSAQAPTTSASSWTGRTSWARSPRRSTRWQVTCRS